MPARVEVLDGPAADKRVPVHITLKRRTLRLLDQKIRSEEIDNRSAGIEDAVWAYLFPEAPQ